MIARRATVSPFTAAFAEAGSFTGEAFSPTTRSVLAYVLASHGSGVTRAEFGLAISETIRVRAAAISKLAAAGTESTSRTGVAFGATACPIRGDGAPARRAFAEFGLTICLAMGIASTTVYSLSF